MESPEGTSSDVWILLQEELALQTKVCVYDRAGIGLSYDVTGTDRGNFSDRDRDGPPHTSSRMVSDLHRLVTKATDGGQLFRTPLVLVGSQLGALNTLVFSRKFPKLLVSHVVLIHPATSDLLASESSATGTGDWEEDEEPLLILPSWKTLWAREQIPALRLLRLTAGLGLNRIARHLGLFRNPLAEHLGGRGLSEAAARVDHLMSDPGHLTSALSEVELLEVSIRQAEEALTSEAPGNVRLEATVITGTHFDALLPPSVNEAWSRSALNMVSKAFVGQECRHHVIDGADRTMIYERPAEVAEPIKKIVRRIRGSLAKAT